MIELKRGPRPASLDSDKIRAYLADLQQYREEVAQFEAGTGEEPMPPITNEDYRSSDLLKAFESQFFSKCYLTEEQFEGAGKLEVDHFIPRAEAKELLFDWDNLFPISPTANRMRLKKTPVGGYLNPCVDPVEAAIVATYIPVLDSVGFKAADPHDQKANNTVALLNHLHHGKGNTEITAKALRQAIKRRYDEIVQQYIKYTRPNSEAEGREAEMYLRYYFSREAAFTMLMRCTDLGRRCADLYA